MAAAIVATGLVSTSLVSDEATMVNDPADPNQQFQLTAQLSIDTFLGVDTATSSDTTSVVAVADANFTPNGGKYDQVTMEGMIFELGELSFTFDVFCSVFGCYTVDLQLSNFTLTQQSPIDAAINKGGGCAFQIFTANTATYVVSGDLVDASGDLIGEDFCDFTGNFDFNKDMVTFSNMTLADKSFEMDPADLPTGVDGVTVVFSMDISSVMLMGELIPGDPVCEPNPDQNLDGFVDGIDLGIVLGNWATAGPLGDVNCDGMVDGGDIGGILGNWLTP